LAVTGFLSCALYTDVHGGESAGRLADTTTSEYDDNNDNDNDDAIAWTTHDAQLSRVIDGACARMSSLSLSRPTPA